MDYLLKESNPNEMKPEDFAKMLEESAAKLKRAADIITGKFDDAIGFTDDKNDNKNSTLGVK